MLAALALLLPLVPCPQEFRARTFDLSVHPDGPGEGERIWNLIGEGDDLLVAVGEVGSGYRGRVLCFRKEGGQWRPGQTLEAYGPITTGDSLITGVGKAMALEGDLLLVAVESVGINGSVQVYRRTGSEWIASGSLEGDSTLLGFGGTLALVNGTALVGRQALPRSLEAWRPTEAGWENTGAIPPKEGRLLYGRTSSASSGALIGTRILQFVHEVAGEWQVECLPGEISDTQSVALWGNRAVVGVLRDPPEGSDKRDEVRILERGEHGWETVHVAQEGSPGEFFGDAVATAGEWTVVGLTRLGNPELHVLRSVDGQWVSWDRVRGYGTPSLLPGTVVLREDGEFFATGPQIPGEILHYEPAFRARDLGPGVGREPRLEFQPEDGVVARVTSDRIGALGLLLVSPFPLQRPFLGGTLFVGAPRRALLFRSLEGGNRLRLIRPGQEVAGATLHLQALLLDPEAPQGISLSRGRAITLSEPAAD